MSEIKKKTFRVSEDSIYNVVKASYSEYQMFANDGQFIPGIDGLKKVYRRLLLGTRKIANSKFTKTAQVIGYVMGNLHPHSDSAQVDVMNTLVRWGLISGQGNFGSTSTYRFVPGAAMRYTEVMVNHDLDEILYKLLDYAPYSEGELGVPEPKFFIMPIPVCLLRGLKGIGCGGGYCKIPGFTYESILEAYKADDPTLLRSAYGLKINFEESDIEKLWRQGFGKLVLEFDVKWDERTGSTILSGDFTPGSPDLTKLLEWQDEGWLTIDDETKEETKLIFTRTKGVRKINDDMIWDEVNRIAKLDAIWQANYNIMFAHEGKISRMGIKSWLDITMSLYKDTFKKWKELEVKKQEHKIDIVKLIPKVYPLVLQHKTPEEISQKLGKPINMIKSILSKPIRLLDNYNVDAQVDKINAVIAEIQSAKVSKFIKSGVDLDKALHNYKYED